MAATTILGENMSFENEFKRCCNYYDKLDMFIAWIGDPKNIFPFEYIHSVSNINAVVGIAFYQSHPDGIRLLMEITSDVRIAKDNHLFHPKVYIFSNKREKEIFIGSSNFTYQGFYQNFEVNVLISGKANDNEIAKLEKVLDRWKSSEFSVTPDDKWLLKYTELYNKHRKKLKESGLQDESSKEKEATHSAAWLAIADWDTYIKRVVKGLKNPSLKYDDNLFKKIALFEKYASELKLPWKIEYFNDIEKRRLISGIRPYGWLGHVAASGDFRRMLANGTIQEHKAIVNSINAIYRLSYPLDFEKLRIELNNLVALGPTMKVWGRLLALIKPDYFCTISAPRVRKAIGKTLGKPEYFFQDVDGYIMLLRLIHSSPWFKSKEPLKKNEHEIWKRRAAFLDVIFY